MRTLLVDNYDSYTYNLFQLLARVNGAPPLVARNDALTWASFLSLGVDNVVISPGPGRPDIPRDFGICARILRDAAVPVLGVCLGHQGIGMVYGGKVVAAPAVMHGHIDAIFHDGDDLFAGIPQGFKAVRYHSLAVASPLPSALVRTASSSDDVIMGLRHRERPLWGVQFHPESICTEYGDHLLVNFRRLTLHWQGRDHVERSRTHRGVTLPHSTTPSVPVDAEPPSPYAARVRRLERWHDAEQVFMGLYGDAATAFWLDSSRAEPGLSRFSYMGACEDVIRYHVGEQARTTDQGGAAHATIFDRLRHEIARRGCPAAPDVPFEFHGGFVGYWGYELKAECGGVAAHRAPTPDALCMFADRVIVFDHHQQMMFLLHVGDADDGDTAERWFDATEQRLHALPPLPLLPLQVTVDVDDLPLAIDLPHDRYLDAIAACQEALRAGESYEICLTTQMSIDANVDPLALYRHLRRVNPAPYAAFLRSGELAVLSSSPERLLRIDERRQVEAKPIKGTAGRGATEAEDRAIRAALRQNAKARAENLMIADLLRNDLGMVCEVGSVHVPRLMDVETYATVHQMVSTIRGTLRADVDALACLQAAFPGGSMTGAPKLRTMEIIDRLEGAARGVYAGALGWVGLHDTADLSVVIRTIVWTPDRLTLGAGGAITVDSDPEAEWDEMRLKARPLLRAIAHTTESPVLALPSPVQVVRAADVAMEVER